MGGDLHVFAILAFKKKHFEKDVANDVVDVPYFNLVDLMAWE